MLSERLEFVLDRDAELFSAVPAGGAVFLLRSDDPRNQPYVAKTANLRRRLLRLLGSPKAPTKRLNLRDRVRWVEYTPSGSEFESSFLLYKVLRASFPKAYSDRLRLRFAPVVKLHLENEYPRASITTRLGRTEGRSVYYGPFPSRAAAEKFANDSLDFFKMRRCVEDLDPDPTFPGCVYSEMKMCLAPCFKGCSDDEYREEVARVRDYFDSRGQSLQRELSRRREQASSELEFEGAAAIHSRLEKLAPVLGQLAEIVHPIDRLNAVIVQTSLQPGSVALFRIDSGCISGPLTFAIQSAEHTKSQSAETRVQEALDAAGPGRTKTALETMEHLALLKRWYYGSSRIGEIFFADEKGALPMRRLVRGIGRVYRGEKSEAPLVGVMVAPQ